jgi:hypothetical protein
MDRPFVHYAEYLSMLKASGFGRRTVIGIVHTISTFTTVRNLKSIQDVLDAGPVMSEELLDLSDWISGYNLIAFDAGNLPSGVYYYRMVAGPFAETRKLMIVK